MEGHQVLLRGKSNSLEQMMWSIVEKEECASHSYLSIDLKVQMWGEEVSGTQTESVAFCGGTRHESSQGA